MNPRRVDCKESSTLLFSLTIPGLVQPKQSTRVRVVGGKAHGYQPTKVKNYEAYVRGLASQTWRGCGHFSVERHAIDQPVSLRITFWLPRPTTRPGSRRKWPAVRPDWLNLVKPIEDAIVKAGVLCDDGRVVHADVWKRYATDEHPAGVEVELHLVGDEL